MQKRQLLTFVTLMFAVVAIVVVGCGGDEGGGAAGKAFKIGYNEDFTGVMSVDAALAHHGIQTALSR